ncbi:phage integrase SAM-like domain-containing protein [Haloimpatiens lingqiaonensis]|uniref:phage integrase SAM-like domain-containing protein n=1 Tax=Haloimpatiens lingqiaonensis TaxID=1380675 RepID=UPI0010FD2832|nr:phage integrase SAM-like domain-containing protein [Haloimpatiens lingqiaonensis]
MKRGEVVGTRQFGKKLNNQRKKYSELYNEFVQQLEIKVRDEQTLTSYHYHSKYFTEFLGEDIYCDEITLTTLENYIVYIKEVKKITNGITINSYLSNISPIIKFGMKKRLYPRRIFNSISKRTRSYKRNLYTRRIKFLYIKVNL